MADNKITDIEMSAILAAFAESREIKDNLIHQSKIFMALIIFFNMYVLTSLVIYYLSALMLSCLSNSNIFDQPI